MKTVANWGITMHRLTSFAATLSVSLFATGCTDAAPETQMVDVDGVPTRALTLGLDDRLAAQPVIVLFSGAGAPIEAWGDWASELSSLGPVVTYDRPGIGQSPFDGIDPTPEQVVSHAQALLGVLDVPPPYVLVGWSWGGPLVRHFAGAYPDEVVGLVYLDPTDMMATPLEMLGTTDEEELQRRYAELDDATANLDRPPGIAAEQRVIRAFNRSPIEDRGLPRDLEVPTAVVLATQAPPISRNAPSYVTEQWFEDMFARRVAQFGEWAQDRTYATLTVAADSGHAVHLDAPGLAFEAVRSVVGDVVSQP